MSNKLVNIAAIPDIYNHLYFHTSHNPLVSGHAWYTRPDASRIRTSNSVPCLERQIYHKNNWSQKYIDYKAWMKSESCLVIPTVHTLNVLFIGCDIDCQVVGITA